MICGALLLGPSGIYYVLPAMVFDLMFGWRNWVGMHLSDIWNIVPLCLTWTVWMECAESTRTQLLATYSSTLFAWSSALSLMNRDSIPIFLELLRKSLFIIL